MISIIVPVYNVEKYIDRCIESVLNQTYTDFELIVIDDGSTDMSGDKCVNWANKDSRIRLIRKNNEGLGPTRNLGVRLSKYDYITFLDSDDWWEEKYLEMMILPVEKYSVDIVCCDIHYWEINDNIVRDKISELRITPNKILLTSDNKDLINRARTFAWGKIFKKSLFNNNNIEQPAHAFEDVSVIPLVVALADTIYRVDKPLYYYYRNRKGSLANNNKMLVDMEKSLNELIDVYKKYELFDLYNKELSKLIYSQSRFIINRNRSLCDDISTKKFDEVFEAIINDNFPDSLNIGDDICCIGNGTATKIAKLLTVSNKHKNNKKIEDKIIFVNLTENIEYIDNLIEELKYELLVNENISKIIILEGDINSENFTRKYSKIKEDYIGKILCFYNVPSSQMITESQLWDLADDIFYSI